MNKIIKSMSLGLMISILIVSGCSSNDEETGKTSNNQDRDELVISLEAELDDGFDSTAGWGGMYGSPLFQSTLLTYDPEFNIENDLAENYEISDDGLQYVVDIRDDVVFSDEEPLTASDVAFTFETAKHSESKIDLNNMDKAEATGDHEVTFTLKEPDSTFIVYLITTGIVPEHAYDENYNEKPVGSGPYQLVEWKKDQQLIVEKNPHYYGEVSHFNKLTFLFLESDAAFAAAQAGELDVASIPPSFTNHEIEGMEVVDYDTVDNRGIMFPFEAEGEETEDGHPIGNNVTSDEAIRKAIDIGVDRQALIDGVLEGYGTTASSIADHLPWWNPETEVKDKDVAGAEEILEDGGWEKNADGFYEKDGLKAEFTLLYPADDEVRQVLSMAVAEQITELGIDVDTNGRSWDNLVNEMFSNPVMMGWGSHDPLEIYNIYSSTTKGDPFHNGNYYGNETVDEYMEQALKATTEEESYEYWKKAQWDGETGLSSKGDAPYAWLVNLQHIYLVNEDLDIGAQKLHPHGPGWPVTDFIEKWTWKE